MQRDNVRLLRAAGSFNPRPKDFLNIQQMNHDVFFTRFTRLDNDEVESWDLYVTWWDWHFKSGDNIHGILDFNPTYERLFEPFEISPGVILAPGEYRFTRFRSNLFSTAAKRRLSGSANVTLGQLLVGKGRAGATASITYKLPPRFTISLNTQSDVRAAAGRQFHRADRHLERELRRVPVAVVLEPDSVRQPVEQSRLAEPRPLDAAARQRPVLRVQPGLDPGRRTTQPAASERRTARCPRSSSIPSASEGVSARSKR